MISPSSTNSMVTEVGDYIFRVCFIDSFQGRAMAGFAKKKGLIKVATLVDQASPYSAGLAEEFRSAYKDAGHEIVIEETYMEGDQDFLRQLTEISAKEPDAVFIPGYYPEVGRIAKQVSEMNMNVTLLGGDAWDSPELLTISKGKFPTAFFTNHYLPDVSYPENKTFVESYTKYGKPDAFAALAYDAAKVLFNAIRRAGSTAPEKIRDELARTQNFRGATGLISINPSSRNAEKEVVFVMVKPGCTKDCFKEAR
jgi:branched-chain amino acid transport system substrate-binding protein